MIERHYARIALAAVFSFIFALGTMGCQGTVRIDDPVGTLADPEKGPRRHLAAMERLDEAPLPDPAYLEELERIVWRAGYTPDTRAEAVDRLKEYDLDGLKTTLRRNLARMSAWGGVTRLCEIIAEEGWTDLSPTLVRSWSRQIGVATTFERPEYRALAKMYGEDEVIDVVFDILLESRGVAERGLRRRTWELLVRLGEDERLREWLETTAVPADDVFLADVQATYRELGILPVRAEEILWVRKLREPGRASFWGEASAATALLPPATRDALEMRDLALVVASARHMPELLDRTPDDLFASLRSDLAGAKFTARAGEGPRAKDRLNDWRGELRWGDLVAMHLARRAMNEPAVIEHLFDYARRDREDTSTEYGGVITLDTQGRFEVLEYRPQIRENDQKFIGSQRMFDAGYTALFHFHFHVQNERNERFAGPGLGDQNYADNTRANCLVMTSVRPGVMNLDYYRYDRVQVDLGEVEHSRTVAHP